MAYGRVEETFWHDRTIRDLSEDGRHLMLYLLTSPHRNRLGCYVLDTFYVAADIQWTVERVTDAMYELKDAGRIGWDTENRVVLVKRFLRYNTLDNQNVVKGAISDLKALPDTDLLIDVLAVLRESEKAHYQPIVEALANRCANSKAKGSPEHRLLDPAPAPSPIPTPEPEPSPSSNPPATEGSPEPEVDWISRPHWTRAYTADELHRMRKQDMAVVKASFHLGEEKAEFEDGYVGMPLEERILIELRDEDYDPADLHAALPFVRQAEEFPDDQPITLKLLKRRREVFTRALALAQNTTPISRTERGGGLTKPDFHVPQNAS